MKIFINNQVHHIATNSALSSLPKQLNMTEKTGFAIAVNNTVISKKDWDKYHLHEKDKITIIKATQGG